MCVNNSQDYFGYIITTYIPMLLKKLAKKPLGPEAFVGNIWKKESLHLLLSERRRQLMVHRRCDLP
jgi:hypothetical protein